LLEQVITTESYGIKSSPITKVTILNDSVQEPLRKKAKRKSASNKTRFSDSKVKYLYKANKEMKKMEEDGRSKMWESVYKQICNDYILKRKEEEVKDTLPETSKMTRDIEDDAKQSLADC
jgi:hypothetical protein